MPIDDEEIERDWPRTHELLARPSTPEDVSLLREIASRPESGLREIQPGVFMAELTEAEISDPRELWW